MNIRNTQYAMLGAALAFSVAALASVGSKQECPSWMDEELTHAQKETILEIEKECVEFHARGGRGPSCDFGSYSDATFWRDARDAGWLGEAE